MRVLLLCLVMGFAFIANAQVDFETISFEQALKRSAQESKVIFLQFEAAECTQCNEVAIKGLSDKELSKLIGAAFIPVKISANHPDRKAIGTRYNIEKGFGTLFINQNGTLVHKFTRTTTNARDYFTEVDQALNKAGESLKVDEMEKTFRSGNNSIGFVEALLLKKRNLGLSSDDLLEEYIALLPEDSLQSTRTLAFIAQMAPVLDSKADKVLRKNAALFNKVWYSLDLNTRININRTIASKSMEEAIQQKSESKAVRVAFFFQSTYQTNKAAGERAFRGQLLRYYERTNDTAKFLAHVIPYYGRYYMTLSADSIKRIDSLNKVRLRDQSTMRDTVLADGRKVKYTTTAFRPIAQNYTNDLNYAADKVYEMTNNPDLLQTATAWIKRGLEFFETPEALDTYSKLLYRQGEKTKATELQQKLITIRKERGFPTNDQEAVLDKMKKGLPL